MQGGLQKQPQIKILPAIRVNERLQLRNVDIEEVVKTVKGVLPQNVDVDIDVTIMLLEKNLKVMSDMALLEEALTQLVRNAMPGCGELSLTINHVNFDIESLLKSDDSIIGGCAFIPFTGIGTYVCVDAKIKEKILEPFFITKKTGNGLGLAMAYRILKEHQYPPEINIYLPLTKLEIANMMSIHTV